LAFYRKKWEGAKVGRINLYSIIQTDASNSPLYKVALAYLKQLYGDYMSTNKNDPARIQKVFDEVLRIQKTLLRQGKDPFELFEIKLKDPRLNAVFYKMLKGTNLYDLETNKGYLPLELAIEFSESANAPIRGCPKSS
jgi:hypothetical protein